LFGVSTVVSDIVVTGFTRLPRIRKALWEQYWSSWQRIATSRWDDLQLCESEHLTAVFEKTIYTYINLYLVNAYEMECRPTLEKHAPFFGESSTFRSLVLVGELTSHYWRKLAASSTLHQ